MKGWLSIFFPPLEVYDIEKCPTNTRVEKVDTQEPSNAKILNGQKWEDEWLSANQFTSERIVSSKPGKRVRDLTDWDRAYLNNCHKNVKTGEPTWKAAMAEKLKDEWATPHEDGEYPSAETVERMHTVRGEAKAQKGYSLSNIKKYFHAFNQAIEREIEEMGCKSV